MARILVVDERVSNREFLAAVLQGHGHQLKQVADAREALHLARAERPDLIIADVLLPTMDGREFVLRLQSDPAVARTPVVFSAARYLEREAIAVGRSCGVSSVLALPSDPKGVLSLLDSALHSSTSSSGGARPEVIDPSTQKLEELKVMNLRQAALLQLNLVLASERDAARLLRQVCKSARRIIGSKYSSIAIVDDNGALEHFYASGFETESVAKPDNHAIREGLY